MNTTKPLAVLACALVLAGCGNQAADVAEVAPATVTVTETETEPAPEPVEVEEVEPEESYIDSDEWTAVWQPQWELLDGAIEGMTDAEAEALCVLWVDDPEGSYSDLGDNINSTLDLDVWVAWVGGTC